MGNENTLPRWRRWLTLSRWLFGPLAVAFLVAAAIASHQAFGHAIDRIQPGWLVGLVLAWASLHLLMPTFTRIVLEGLGYRFSYAESLRIHVSRLPSRYLPGGVWHTVSRMADFRERGVPMSALATLVILENSVPLAVALLVGGVLADVAAGPLPGWPAALSGALLLLATPVALGYRPFGTTPAPRISRLAAATGLFVAMWILAALLFAAYLRAAPLAGSTPGLAQAMSTYLLAWAAGFMAVFAPQGIGVFELVASLMLGGGSSVAAIAVLVAGFRAITLAGDGVAWMTLASVDVWKRMRGGR